MTTFVCRQRSCDVTVIHRVVFRQLWLRRWSGSSTNHWVDGSISHSTCQSILGQDTEPLVAPDGQASAFHSSSCSIGCVNASPIVKPILYKNIIYSYQILCHQMCILCGFVVLFYAHDIYCVFVCPGRGRGREVSSSSVEFTLPY